MQRSDQASSPTPESGDSLRLPERDLDHAVHHAARAFESFRASRIFITGATRFVGNWLVQSLMHANEKLGLSTRAVLLVRSEEEFRRRLPFLSGMPGLELAVGDMGSFSFPQGEFPFVVHGATARAHDATPQSPFATYDADVEGTRRVLQFSASRRARRFLFLSSGAIYGRVPSSGQPIPEDYPGAPATTEPESAYAQAKRTSEWMCTMYSRQFGFSASIARLFAFIGPLLPQNDIFAAGNFVRDALAGGPVRVGGDGKPLRSYLYGADLAAWLWTILASGASGRAYNVGGSQPLAIASLADSIAACPRPAVQVQVENKPGVPSHDYVPDVSRALRELSLRAWVSPEEGARRMYDWYAEGGGQSR